jgi:hypothetical protein
MNKCHPNSRRYFRCSPTEEWQLEVADNPHGPWRPISIATPADRLALAMCKANSDIGQCERACEDCKFLTAAVANELAVILRERHGSSTTADWLDGISGQQQIQQTP